MAKTRHIHKRMGQRAINQGMLDIVSEHGMLVGDKCVLDCKNIDAIIQSMDRMRKKLLTVRDKGGLVVVEDQGVQITAYRLDSFDRKKKG